MRPCNSRRYNHTTERQNAQRRRDRPLRRDLGFTLIEITIAVVILVSSMAVLIGMQAAAVRRAVQDRDNSQAMLIAREILSAIEISRTPATIPDASGSPEEVLRDVLGAAALPSGELDPQRKFFVELQFEDIALPTIGTDKLRRAVLRVRWNTGPEDGLTVDYFFPTGL